MIHFQIGAAPLCSVTARLWTEALSDMVLVTKKYRKHSKHTLKNCLEEFVADFDSFFLM